MNKSYILIFFIGFFSINANAQLTLSDPDYDQGNPLDCAGIIPAVATNFTDGAANYSPNMSDTIVFCPDLAQGSKVSIAFATNIGFTWDVDGSDTLYIFDGPNTSSPLIGAFNSDTDPLSFFVQASWNNPSGCLTLLFVSDGAIEGTGWDANVACGNPQQPFNPHIEAYINGVGPNALNPLDTGYIDVCFGDSIMLVATPDFPNSYEVNNFGYSQTVNNCTYEWTIGGVGQFTNDTVWFTPPQYSGYFIDLKISDAFPLIENITCKVRVGQLPNFTGTGPLEDTVCLGQNTVLIGGVTPTDTVGVDVPFGEFQVGGIFAGLTQLPDGNGAVYTTTIAISGFDSTTTVTSAADIDELCIDIEHSYIGDLEISLTCPNGTSVSLMNAYNQAGGLIPGGCGNAIGTFLGNDTNIDGGAPGTPVWTYCFSEVSNTLGTICAENALGNWVINDYGFQAMNPNGVYLPDGSWNGFAGCPINGNWVITVQDNQGIDDGYIFQWGLFFNQSLYPNSEGYQNYIVDDFWTNDPTIISGQTDTAIIVQPVTPGDNYYTYNVIDDYGCTYDTTVTLYVLPQPTILADTSVCGFDLLVAGTVSYNGGVWSSPSPDISFSPSANVENPQISTTTAGSYIITYTDDACNTPVTVTVDFSPNPTFNLQGSMDYCEGTGGTFLEILDSATISSISWGLPDPAQDSIYSNTLSAGTFTLNASDAFGICLNDTTFTVIEIPAPSIFSSDIACDFSYLVTGTTSYAGGVWSCTDPAISFLPSANVDNPQITTSTPGIYTLTYIDNYCQITETATINFPQTPNFNLIGSMEYCEGTGGTFLEISDSTTMTNITWGLANPGLDSLFSNTLLAGTYTLDASDATVTCLNDTTFTVIEIPAPSIFSNDIGCDYSYWVTGTSSYAGGSWSSVDTAITFLPSANVENPQVTTSTPGIYTITYTDSYCQITETATIDFPPYPWTWLSDTTLCIGAIYNLTAVNENNYPTTYEWNTGQSGQSISISEPGIYTVTVSNVCHSGQNSMVVDYQLCDIVAPNVISIAPGSQNPLWYVEAEGLASFNLTITNRWGNVVYSCNNAQANCYWDGTSQNGAFVEEGTYFYTIDATVEGGQEIQKHGFIQVID